MKWKGPVIAAAAGAAAYVAGQAFWNRHTALERGASGFAEKGILTQLWESTPDLIRVATVGTLSGLAAFYAAKRLA